MMRRIIDIVVSACVLLVFSPIFLIIALAIRLDSPGSVIYRGWRIGKGGRGFQMLKFRSMIATADRVGPAISSHDDARVTRVGRFLRATKLDEFPQFWNVLRGNMTLIGPRPETPEIVSFYTPEQLQILSVKPGLTGPSQISCSVDDSMAVHEGNTAEQFYVQNILGRRLAMDADYIRNRNAVRDLALVGKTVGLILRVFLRGTA